ncbi:hypothetical protein ABEF95_005679 [Exophiala dermatitidis]
MSFFRSLILLTASFYPIVTYAFVDFGYSTLPNEPLHLPTPKPYQLPKDSDLRFEILPSMITAVAPSITIAANGTRETLYSLHYHHYFSKTRQGKGLFKRGVFANDPPIATCTPCGGAVSTGNSSSSSTTPTASCTTHYYHGVFQYPDPASTTSYCYNSNYTGVFEPSTTSSSGLPCCFTIPASYSTSTMSGTTSTTSSSSVLSSVQYTSGTSSRTSSTTSPSASVSIIVVSSTTITITNSGSSTTTTGSGTSSTLSTLTVITATPVTSTTSVVYTNITTTVPNTIEGCGTASGSGVVEGTGTVYLADTSIVASGTASGSASQVVGCGTVVATSGTFTGSASITGCGYGSGTGTLTGTGTIWPAAGGGLVSRVGSGIVSGNGRFEGCGTLTGSGTFVATGPYTTVIGAPVTTSSGSASSTRSRSVTTIEVYVSYCPGPMDGAAALKFGTNSTSPTSPTSLNNSTNNSSSHDSGPAPYSGPDSDANPRFIVPTTHGSGTNGTTNGTDITSDNALCNTCPNSVGICCPPTVDCDDDDGKCPLFALENSHNTINGYLIAQVMNSTAPVAGRKKVRGLMKPKTPERDNDVLGDSNHLIGSGYDDDTTTTNVKVKKGQGQVHKHHHGHNAAKKAHKRQF